MPIASSSTTLIVSVVAGLVSLAAAAVGFYLGSLRRRGWTELPSVTLRRQGTVRRPTPELPEELVEALAQGDAVLFAGAGLTVESDGPTFAQLLDAVADQLQDAREVDVPRLADIRSQIAIGEINLAAELLAARYPQDALAATARRIFARPLRPGPTLDVLSRSGFAGVITDDWSGVVTRAFGSSRAISPWEGERLSELERAGSPFALELFGGADHNRALLSTQDLQRILEEARSVPRTRTPSTLSTPWRSRCSCIRGAASIPPCSSRSTTKAR